MKIRPVAVTFGAAALIAGLAGVAPAQSQDLIMVTGSQGGTWYPMGGAIKTEVEKALADVNVQVRPGGGIANIKAIGTGKAHLGVGNTISTVDAINGRDPFGSPVENVCHISYMYPQYIQGVVVNMDMKTYDDFKDRNLAVVQRGNTAEQVARMVLQIHGLNYNDLNKVNFASMSDQVNMMKDGQVDGFFQTTSVPAGVVMDVAASKQIRVLPLGPEKIAELKKINPGFIALEIPAKSYPHQDEMVQTGGFGTHIIAACDLPEDLVYGITKAMSENLSDMALAIAPLKKLSREAMAQDVGVPYHPGTEKYYREVGLLK